MPNPRGVAVAGLAAVWLAAVVAGFVVLGRFESTPGANARSHERWPEAAPIRRDPVVPTLLVFAHPRCPCTSATIERLNRLLARAGGNVRTTVLFYDDPALGEEWLESGSYKAAVAIPGVSVVADELGAAARLFGARTSGQVLLYESTGQLRFAGGITPARGHPGDSDGAHALLTALRGNAGLPPTPVYGCALLEPSEGTP